MQVGELLKRVGGFLTRNLLLVPRRFDVLVPLIRCGASAGPAPEEGRNTLPPRAIVDSCTDLDRAQDSRTPPVRCHDVLEIPPCCPCLHEQRPVGTHPVTGEDGAVCDRPPTPLHLAPVKTQPDRTSHIASQRSPGGRIFPAEACKAHNLARASHNPKWKIPERRLTGSAGGNISVFPEFFGEFTQTGEDLLLILCRVLFENGLGRPTKTIGHFLD